MSAADFKEMDESIYDLLAAIRKGPGLHIAEPSINRLHAFLVGYEFGIGRCRHVLKDSVEFHKFHDRVARRLAFGESTSGWCNMIREKSENEKEAFDKFFVLLDEFRKELGTAARRKKRGDTPAP